MATGPFTCGETMTRKTLALLGLGALALGAATVIAMEVLSTPRDAAPLASADAEPRAAP